MPESNEILGTSNVDTSGFSDVIKKKLKELILGEINQFMLKFGSFPGSIIWRNHKKRPRTLLVCYYAKTNGEIGIKYFSRPRDLGERIAKIAYRKLKQNIGNPNPGRRWTPFGTVDDPTVHFGSRPARIYFVMLVPGWKFATKRQDAITSKLPVSNYYSEYRVILDDGPREYVEHIFSIFNNNPFDEAHHDYNVHCLVKIGGQWLPTTIDPKFRNP